jgi:hypothetical protein
MNLRADDASAAEHGVVVGAHPAHRGLLSSTSQLNASALCGIGDARRGGLSDVRGCSGVSRVYFV